MDILLTLDRTEPLRAQLERELRDAIRAGRLRAGSRLPPSRLLAEELEVSRGVVVEAYSQLVAEGYLVARAGDGTRIAGRARSAAARGACLVGRRLAGSLRLRSGVPDLAFFPRREWQSALSSALRELPDPAFGYGSRRGLRQLRIALSELSGRVRAAVAEPDRMFITAGAAHGMGHPVADARGSVGPSGSPSRTRPGRRSPTRWRRPDSSRCRRVDGTGLEVDELERARGRCGRPLPGASVPDRHRPSARPARRADRLGPAPWGADRRGRLRRRIPLRPGADRLAAGSCAGLRRVRGNSEQDARARLCGWGGCWCRATSSARWRPSTG